MDSLPINNLFVDPQGKAFAFESVHQDKLNSLFTKALKYVKDLD